MSVAVGAGQAGPGAVAIASDRTYKIRQALEAVLVPLVSLAGAAAAYAVFLLALGKAPDEFVDLVWRGAFGSAFSITNTVQRAAPLLLTALCVALPAQLGLVIIGGEGAVVLGGLAAIAVALPFVDVLPQPLLILVMGVGGAVMGALWIGFAGFLRAVRGINETISSLVLSYIAIALFNHLVEGVLRDPASLNKPSTWGIGDNNMMGAIPGLGWHPGLPVGVVCCIAAWLFMSRTTTGFAACVTGGNLRAAQLQGLPVRWLMILACALGGACAGLAGMIQVAAIDGRANASLIAGYGYTGILISFLARHNPIAIMPMAFLLGGITAAGGLLQRRMDLPDASVLVLEGLIFVAILTGETLYGRIAWFQPRRGA
jgi:simple sugar transport system permease protein